MIFMILVVIISLVIYSVPRDVDKTYSGYLYSLDGDFGKSITISVKGTIYPKLFSSNRFIGNLAVDNEVVKVNTSHQGEGFFQGLKSKLLKDNYTTFAFSSERGYTSTKGNITFSKDFNKVFGALDILNEKYNIKCQFAAPSDNVIEANSLGESIL
ncbi:hypothetical protein [Dethiothermospora halolimnae]|uniref:hypothetical protein n=1 Tax=Dethiothermospora halolimnae TaxID=3114390 RepID=UPI003CCBD7CE